MEYFGVVPNEGYHNKAIGFRSYFLSFGGGVRLEIMTRPSLKDGTNDLTRTGYAHLAFSLGGSEGGPADRKTARERLQVLSGPRTTGDGYYESCILGFEGNQIELTV